MELRIVKRKVKKMVETEVNERVYHFDLSMAEARALYKFMNLCNLSAYRAAGGKREEIEVDGKLIDDLVFGLLSVQNTGRFIGDVNKYDDVATPIEIGTEIYYTGDMADASGFFRVTNNDSVVYMEEIGGTRKFGVRPVQIGHVYNGTCNPRFVTKAARNAYVAERLPALTPKCES